MKLSASAERSPEIPEFNFENGLKEIARIANEMLQQKDLIVMGVNGSGINVGKTTLVSQLSQYFQAQDCIVITSVDTRDFERALDEWKRKRAEQPTQKTIIILKEEEIGSVAREIMQRMKSIKNKILKQVLERHVFQTPKTEKTYPTQIDLWIAIQSTSEKFPKQIGQQAVEPFGDILITNQHATIKPTL